MHAQPKASAPQPKASPLKTRPAVVSNSSVTVSGPIIGGTRTIALPWMNNFENKGTGTQAGLMARNGHNAYQIKVNGVISLHRASAPAEKSAGNYMDCDPIIHDWLNQAESRAPAECEVKFDQVVRAAMTKAFDPTYAAFAA